MPFDNPQAAASHRPGGRRETMMQAVKRMSMRTPTPSGGPHGGRPTMLQIRQSIGEADVDGERHQPAKKQSRKRARAVRAKSELWCAKDLAKVFPISVRKIQDIAAQGGLGAFKLQGCSTWFFSETVVREQIAIYINGLPKTSVTPCGNRKKSKTRTTTSSSVKTRGIAGTSSTASPNASRFLQRMSSKHGKPATQS
jgi:hypothetical protein